jgi:hypothetical protein
VTSDGNVNYRGNQNLTIYFDGKPAGILSSSRANALSLYPADQIDRIEIISNPGAKYSAEGSSGILNIILKKGSKTESLRLNSNLGTNDKYALSATYAKGYKRWTHLVDLNLRQNIRNNYQYLYRENPSPFGFSQIAQTTNEINRDFNQSIRLNSIYTFSKDRTFGISFIGRLSSDHNSEVRYNKSEFSYAADRFYARDADKNGRDIGFDLNLSYSPSANGKIDFLWIQNQGSDANQFFQHYYYGDLTPLIPTFLYATSVHLPPVQTSPCYCKAIGLSPFQKSFRLNMDLNSTRAFSKIHSYMKNRRRGFMSKIAFVRMASGMQNTFKRPMFLLPAKVPYYKWMPV